ncbi:MAG: hypothetical protein EOO99_09490 [Pedobacter sp.]|nr:MAG: hypothetical protein EOO99_09490 [Pedobacter sp.]
MKAFLLSMLLIYASIGASAQVTAPKYQLTPLDSLLRQHVDTIFVFYTEANSMLSNSSIAYITKKDSLVNLFKYDMTFRRIPLLPKSLYTYLFKREILMMSDPKLRTINENFQILDTPQDLSQQLWRDIMKFDPVNMQDDSTLGSGCREDESAYTKGSIIEDHNIYDGGYLHLAMITKDEINFFKFYSPNHFLQTCKPTTDRQTIVGIEKLITQYIPIYKR